MKKNRLILTFFVYLLRQLFHVIIEENEVIKGAKRIYAKIKKELKNFISTQFNKEYNPIIPFTGTNYSFCSLYYIL